jgi:NAD(P)-dependent dehydrogenase (short-subunit alcohol dehydrogenase family)
MAERAAIVTGGSSGIGLAIAHMLGEEGFGLTVAARRPEKLEGAADELRAAGYDVVHVAGDLASEDTVKQVVQAHSDRFGRLDMLVNNAGVGFGAPVAEIKTKHLDMQLGVNVRSMVLFYRECVELLKAAAKENKTAHVINTASIAGKKGTAWLSVYSATKHAMVGFTQAMNMELGAEGVRNTALCPAFVDTPMTDFAKAGGVAAEEMMTPADIAEGVRMLLRLSPVCVIPELIFERPGESI